MAEDIAYLELVAAQAAGPTWSAGATVLVGRRAGGAVAAGTGRSPGSLIGQYHNSSGRTPGSPLTAGCAARPPLGFLRQGYDPFSPDGPGHFPVVYAKTMAMIDAEPELDLATFRAVPAPTLVL